MQKLSKETMLLVNGGNSGETPYKVGGTWYIQCAALKYSPVLGKYYQCGKIYQGTTKLAVITDLDYHYAYNPEHDPSGI